MLTERKNNILFIDADSDSNQSDAPKHTQESPSQLGGNSVKLQGNYKLNNQKIKKNFLVQHEKDYEYQHIIPARRKTKKMIYETNEDTVSKVQIINPSSELFEDKTQKVSNEIVKNVKANNQQKIFKAKILHFQLDDSDDISETEEGKNEHQLKLKQDIQNMIQNDESQSEQKQKPQQLIFGKQNSEEDSKGKNSNEEEEEYTKITPVSMIEESNKMNFNRTPIPEQCMLDGTIVHYNQSLSYFYPHFDLLFKNYSTHILSCKKQAGAFGSNYYISTQQKDVKDKNQNYLGKLRSTSEPDVYNIFDNGERVIQTKFDSKKRQIAATIYITSGNGPRRLEVYVLKHGVSYQTLHGSQDGTDIGLHKLYLIESNKNNIYFFEARKPEWIPQFGKYFLNFGGKVKQASIRNFILEDAQTKKKVMLFGKQKDHHYNIQIWHPLPPWIALGILVPQFQKND